MDWMMNQYVERLDYLPSYSDYRRLRTLAWIAGLMVATIAAVLSALKSSSTEVDSVDYRISSRSALLMAASIAVQQALIFFSQSGEIMLIHVSAWVGTAPVRIIWCLWFLVPLVFIRPLTAHRVCRGYAVGGWILVAAALGWNGLYRHLCTKYGVPVSWAEVEKDYVRGSQERLHEEMISHGWVPPSKKPNQSGSRW
jgi:hypothetical protein